MNKIKKHLKQRISEVFADSTIQTKPAYIRELVDEAFDKLSHTKQDRRIKEQNREIFNLKCHLDEVQNKLNIANSTVYKQMQALKDKCEDNDIAIATILSDKNNQLLQKQMIIDYLEQKLFKQY